MKIFKILFMGVMALCLVNPSNADVVSANAELSSRAKKISDICNKHPMDSQLRLGAAELYRLAGLSEVVSFQEEYQAVLRIDPTNRPARAILMEYMISGHLHDIKKYYKDLEVADREERGEIKYPPGSVMYDYIKNYVKTEEDHRTLRKDMARSKRISIITGGQWPSRSEREKMDKLTDEDIGKAVVARRDELKKKSFFLIAELDKAQQNDPSNAIYNYSKASIYLEESAEEKALNEVREGTRKSPPTAYIKERIRARIRVLEGINFPWPERGHFLLAHRSFGGHIRTRIYNNLIKIGKNYEQNNKHKEAENLYKMVVDMGKQLGKDPFFVTDKIEALGIKRVGYRSLETLYQTMKLEKKRGEVSQKLKALNSEKEALFVLGKRYSQYYDESFKLKPSKLKNYKAFINQVIEKGELKALKPE